MTEPPARCTPRRYAAAWPTWPRGWRAGWIPRRPGVPLPEAPRVRFMTGVQGHSAPGRNTGRGRSLRRPVYPVPRLVQTVRLEDREPFITADGSSIREIAGVPSGNSVNQSLAEATVPVGGE